MQKQETLDIEPVLEDFDLCLKIQAIMETLKIPHTDMLVKYTDQHEEAKDYVDWHVAQKFAPKVKTYSGGRLIQALLSEDTKRRLKAGRKLVIDLLCLETPEQVLTALGEQLADIWGIVD